MVSSSGATAAAAADAVVVPAQLGFLAIYNPSLGTTDETFEDQIVYFASSSSSAANDNADEQRNERLRQVGLAQGMVAFGRSFANDQAVDTIETDKARVILHELEPSSGWWLLASVDLTRLPMPGSGNSDVVEYSSREVKPAALLRQDLLRAHAVFLLHHGASLQAVYAACDGPSSPRGRVRFCGLLARYWDVFLSSWSVLLHGNPVRDVLPGVRMAACGELGFGVGEEERGSGEREVLEGLVTQTAGLVDLVVCKYGELPRGRGGGDSDDVDNDDADNDDNDDDDNDDDDSSRWLGMGNGLGAEDGAIFLGVGALSRPALRSINYWMEDIYSWGRNAYGVADNPSAPARHSKRRKKSVASPSLGSIPEQEQSSKKKPAPAKTQTQRGSMSSSSPPPPLLPPPPVTQLARRTKAATSSSSSSASSASPSTTRAPIPTPSRPSDTSSSGKGETSASSLSESAEGSGATMDKYMSFVKLGYGTYWSLGGGGGGSHDASSSGGSGVADTPSAGSSSKRTRFRNTNRTSGHFLIPLVVDDAAEAEDKTTAKAAVAAVPAKNEGEAVSATATTKEEETAPKQTSEHTVKDAATAKPGSRKPASSLPRCVVVDVLHKGENNDQNKTAAQEDDPPDAETEQTEEEKDKAPRSEKLRVVVYAQRPFLYTFLFKQRPAEEDSDAAAAQEKIVQTLIDRQLSVLHKPLLKSTLYRPDKPSVASGASAMLQATAASASASSSTRSDGIYDLIWDPTMLTIHSTIPNIPEPCLAAAAMMAEANIQQGKKRAKSKAVLPPSLRQQQPVWSRVEALNTHMQILNMYAATRSNGAELERMCKTSRGWWIVWNRIVERAAPAVSAPRYDGDDDGDGDDDNSDGGSSSSHRAPSDAGSDDSTATARQPALGAYTVSKEIFLIRKSSDHPDNIDGGPGTAGGGGGGGFGHLLGGGGGGGSGGGSGLGGFGRASSAMRAFSASAYLGFGGGSGSGPAASGGSAEGTSPSKSASPVRMDAAGAEELAAVAAERNGGNGAGWADGASKIAQGIGIDTKKYIEGLLTLNR